MENRSESLKELAKEILYFVELYQDRIKVPEEFSALTKEENNNIEEVLTFLETLFKVEEKEIETERLRSFVTYDFENWVRQFAIAIIRLLYPKHEELKHYAVYRRLLAQRHMAYAFFHALNDNLLPLVAKFDYFDYAEVHEDLYLGLVQFYGEFYGRFSDNEEAIELLCKYFPQGLDVEQYKLPIAEALHMHVSNAGTPNDTGYAFKGIAQIESYIGTLPPAIIMELLGRYQVRFIADNVVWRHQVHAIITHAQTGHTDKTVLKFLLLDSVILALQMESYLSQKLSGEVSNGIFSSRFFEENYITGTIRICKNPEAYWDKEMHGERTLYLHGEPKIKISLKSMESIEVSSIDKLGRVETLELPYAVADWLLGIYSSVEVEQKIRKLIMGTESQYNEMFFSMLYLDHYRGMKNQIIDFDHKFQYEQRNKKLKRRAGNRDQIETFYGKAVQTLSCIVGKNGTGKTSIIDFLRESFFKMLRLIEDYGVSCERGYIREEDYQEYNILDDGADFLVVFQLGKRSFFLTNISNVLYEGAEPFQAGIYNSVNEFSKVAFFSNMLKNNQEDLFFEDSDRRIHNRQTQEKREIGRSLRGFRQADYSETESFIRRRKAITLELSKEKVPEENEGAEGVVNRELCYQLTFLRNMEEGKVCEYLGIDDHKRFKICSRINGWEEETFTLRDLKDPDQADRLEKKFLFLPDAQIQHFSSGQYAKFAFMSKLYWFLAGYRLGMKRYQNMIGENEFRSEEALLDEETALIFIDEGETYYHPEWQRRYIKTLLDMINDVGKGSKTQIVITTNSPFLLSDVLKEDVTYLAEEKEKRFDHTLGQNIHRLLKENFFMDYTIGEYARELIENIMTCLKNPEEGEEDRKREEIKEIILRYYGKDKEAYSAMQLLIEQIGEPVYRYELENLLEESNVMKEQRSMEQLLEAKRRIEEEISKLEKKG